MSTLLKDAYSTAASLFSGITLPASDYTEEIEHLVYERWRLNELVEEDLDEWHRFFEFVTLENWDVADKLLTSASLITDPLKSFSTTSTTEGSNNTTDTLKIQHDRESADATSGYNNSNATGSTDGTQTAGQDSSSTTTPARVTTVKESDTPQSSATNINNGYLSKISQTAESGTETSATTTSGTDTQHAENASETKSNYLDASSHNASETEQHSGGTESEDSHTTTASGYQVSQAELVMQYRETIRNIKRQVADLWSDAFILFYDPWY